MGTRTARQVIFDARSGKTPSSAWEALVLELMLEIIHAAQALGFAVPEKLAQVNIDRTRTMGAYKASTVVDYDRGQPIELRALFLEPLRQAQQAGVATPRLAALARVLQAVAPKGSEPS